MSYMSKLTHHVLTAACGMQLFCSFCAAVHTADSWLRRVSCTLLTQPPMSDTRFQVVPPVRAADPAEPASHEHAPASELLTAWEQEVCEGLLRKALFGPHTGYRT